MKRLMTLLPILLVCALGCADVGNTIIATRESNILALDEMSRLSEARLVSVRAHKMALALSEEIEKACADAQAEWVAGKDVNAWFIVRRAVSALAKYEELKRSPQWKSRSPLPSSPPESSRPTSDEMPAPQDPMTPSSSLDWRTPNFGCSRLSSALG
jgi:hypothetical protein